MTLDPSYEAGNSNQLSVTMPYPYTTDLRWRVIWLYYVQNYSVSNISELLCVSIRSIYRYIERFNQTGEIKAVTYHHCPKKLLGELKQVILLRLITSTPGIYLSEIESKLFSMFGMHVSLSTICRTLKFMGCTRQVIQRISLQRCDEQRTRFTTIAC